MPVNESNREFIFPGKPRCCGAKTIKTKLQHNTIPLPRTADGKRIENKPSLSLFLTFFSYLFPASHTFFQVSGRFNSRWFQRVVAALSSSCFDPVRNEGDVGGNNNENKQKKNNTHYQRERRVYIIYFWAANDESVTESYNSEPLLLLPTRCLFFILFLFILRRLFHALRLLPIVMYRVKSRNAHGWMSTTNTTSNQQ